jgi:hydroxymethylbilane synthase
VGGGNVAARKAESLANAGFPISVVAERIGERMRDLVDRRGAACAQRRYAAADLEGASLVIAATDDGELNARIVADARAAHVLACDASAPERGDFTMSATFRVGDLTITADSAGASPAFSKRIVQELSEQFGPEYGDAVRALRRMRVHVKEAFGREEGDEILRRLAQRPVAELAAVSEATLICATRRSPLAMIQSRTVAARLAERGIATTMLGVTTTGDRDAQAPIPQIGAVNVFVTELESALRDRRADYAVHSCKDLPSVLPGDLRIAAVSAREDPRDAFCSERYASFESLPAGAIVGTSSPRRHSQLAALRPDLHYETLRGNVDTRLRKLRDGAYDAIVLAMAGLIRLRQGATHVEPFGVERIVPAVGQGALAIETRAADEWLRATLEAAVDDPASRLCITCERAALAAMHAGCSAPIGIHARIAGSEMLVEAAVAAENGTIARHRAQGPVTSPAQAEALGRALAAEMTARGFVATGAGQ